MRSRVPPAAVATLAACLMLSLPFVASADWPTGSSTNLPVCTSPNLQLAPGITTDMAGGAFVAWQDIRNGTDFNIYAQHLLSSGAVDPTWPANGLLVCGAPDAQTAARLVSDGAWGAILVWQDRRSGSHLDVYAHHIRADGSLDPAWPTHGLAVTTAPGSQAPTMAVSDLEGGAIVAWRDLSNDTDLVAARILATGSLDPTWPVGGATIAAGPGAQTSARGAPDGDGGAFVVWQDTRGGPSPDIYAQHLLVNGSLAPGWPANGVAICSAIGEQRFPTLAPDGAGGMLAGWEDHRGGATADVYAHHVLANGVVDPAWPADGRAVCLVAGNQTRAKVLGDATGGVFVAWTDARAGSIPALYAQHLLADGTLDPAWPAGDLAFCGIFGNHGNLVLLPDGAGGALAVWDDGRSGLDVYAHHLLVTGVDPAWPANGRAVGSAAGVQNAAEAAIQDGSGGLIAVWSDTRAGGATANDIYAQRVQANGQLGGTVVGVEVPASGAFAFGPPVPTPSRGDRFGLRFVLPREGVVTVELIDVGGRLVARQELGTRPAGRHEVEWSAGRTLPPGLHFLRLRFGRDSRTVRLITLE